MAGWHGTGTHWNWHWETLALGREAVSPGREADRKGVSAGREGDPDSELQGRGVPSGKITKERTHLEAPELRALRSVF